MRLLALKLQKGFSRALQGLMRGFFLARSEELRLQGVQGLSPKKAESSPEQGRHLGEVSVQSGGCGKPRLG